VRQFTGVLAAVLLGCASAMLNAQTPDGTGKARSPASSEAAYVRSGPIVIAQEVLEGWRFLYSFITEVEFVLCLEGAERDGVIVVEGFRLARMENTSATSVRYHPCTSEKYIGTAHNHPPTGTGAPLCYRSLPDRRSFEQDERAIVDIILCGEDRFIWILKDGTVGGPGHDR